MSGARKVKWATALWHTAGDLTSLPQKRTPTLLRLDISRIHVRMIIADSSADQCLCQTNKNSKKTVFWGRVVLSTASKKTKTVTSIMHLLFDSINVGFEIVRHLVCLLHHLTGFWVPQSLSTDATPAHHASQFFGDPPSWRKLTGRKAGILPQWTKLFHAHPYRCFPAEIKPFIWELILIKWI